MRGTADLSALLAEVGRLARAVGLEALSPGHFALLAMGVLGRPFVRPAEVPGALAWLGVRTSRGVQSLPAAAYLTLPYLLEFRENTLHLRTGVTPALGVLACVLRLREFALEDLGRSSPSRGSSRTPSPGAAAGSRARRPQRAASVVVGKAPRSSPPKPPAPEIALPPPFVAAPVTWEPTDLAHLPDLLRGVRGEPLDFLHAVEARVLAAADRFEELLSPASLQGVDPHAYQQETVRRVLRQFRGRALLADEVGLGKTVEALMILREYQLRGMVRRALVLVPAALVAQWVEELSSKAGLDPLVAGEDGSGAEFWSRPGVLVASQALARRTGHAEAIQSQPWDLVIVDEAHRVKNRSTQTFRLVDGLRSRFLLALTATPVENDLEELYNLVTLLKPGQLATPAEFRKRFVNPKDPTEARNPEKLREMLAEVMVRNTRATCGLALPPRYVSTVAVQPSLAEETLYAEVLRVFRTDRTAREVTLLDTLLLEAGSSPAAVRATLDRALAGGPEGQFAVRLRGLRTLAGEVYGSEKDQALLEILKGHGEKALVFTKYRATLAHLEQVARSAGHRPVVVHGGMDRLKKAEAFQAFRNRADLLLCSDVGSEGQNLQFCRLLVNFDLPWNPMLLEQRIGRLHRYGQTEPVRVFNLCARGTVEDRLLDVLDRRVHLFELVVGEMDMVLGNVVEQRDLEERILSTYATASSEDEIAGFFDAVAEELARARGQYERVRALDQALFGKEFES